MRTQLADLRRQFDFAQRIVTVQEREKLSVNAELAAREPLGEAQVRQQLDRMLADAGWSVQDSGVGQDLWAARGVAVREVATKAGRADYLLYVDRRLVGVIEAKREGADLTGAEQQADEYATGLTASQRRVAWRPELPFRYASDGGATRFRNTLDPTRDRVSCPISIGPRPSPGGCTMRTMILRRLPTGQSSVPDCLS